MLKLKSDYKPNVLNVYSIVEIPRIKRNWSFEMWVSFVISWERKKCKSYYCNKKFRKLYKKPLSKNAVVIEPQLEDENDDTNSKITASLIARKNETESAKHKFVVVDPIGEQQEAYMMRNFSEVQKKIKEMSESNAV